MTSFQPAVMGQSNIQIQKDKFILSHYTQKWAQNEPVSE